jgi:hypothetical protein
MKKIEVKMSSGMISDSNGNGHENKKVYSFVGEEIKSWSEKTGTGTSISYQFFKKEDNRYLLFVQENTQWQGGNYDFWIEKFENMGKLPEHLLCMAGGVIEL